MMWSVPWDLAFFGAIVLGFFVIGLPLITRRVSVPRKVEFEVLADHDLTEAQARYFADLDPQLLAMGYRPVGDRRTLNMQGKALIRTYMCDADPAIIMMNLMTSNVEGAGEHPMNFLEVVTRYADGTVLSTRNAEVSEVLDPLPEHIIQERKALRQPAKLKLAHDARAADLLVRGPTFFRPDEFETVFDEFHERWCLHQIDRGLLAPRSDDPQRLRPTVKAALRGIANFLNPLADNFTVQRFLLAVALGVVAPVAAISWLNGAESGVVVRVAANTGLSAAVLMTAGLAVLLTGIGALTGWLFSGKAFIWSFLLAYVVLRLTGPVGTWTAAGLGLWTGMVATWVAGWSERRHAMV